MQSFRLRQYPQYAKSILGNKAAVETDYNPISLS